MLCKRNHQWPRNKLTLKIQLTSKNWKHGVGKLSQGTLLENRNKGPEDRKCKWTNNIRTPIP